MNGSFTFNCHRLLRLLSNSKTITRNRNGIVNKSYHNSSIRFQTKQKVATLKPQTTLNIFDRKAKKLQRERAALAEDVKLYDYLKEEIGYRLADRIFDIKRTFPKAVDMGCGRGYVSKHVVGECVEELIMTDHSELLMSESVCNDSSVKTKKIVCDEEEDLVNTFEPNSVDLVISNLILHWVNNLPKCFESVNKILKTDGVFLASLFGIDTLFELRSSLQLAELERKGGVSPHISPFTKPADIGGLLMRAGFVMQTIDTEEITVRYPTMFELMEDLKGMGESNAAWNRSVHVSRDTLLAASAIYEQLYADTKKENEENVDGIPATFQIIFLIGWKPDPSKPPPPPKDPTMFSLKDFYKLDELSTEKPQKIPLDEKNT